LTHINVLEIYSIIRAAPRLDEAWTYWNNKSKCIRLCSTITFQNS